MTEQDWSSGFGKAIGVFLNGETIGSPDARGQRVVDDSFLMVFNAHHEALDVTMPEAQWGARWLRTLDTADAFNEGEAVDAGGTTRVDARSVALFRRTG
jgi:glycogen operon protein